MREFSLEAAAFVVISRPMLLFLFNRKVVARMQNTESEAQVRRHDYSSLFQVRHRSPGSSLSLSRGIVLASMPINT
jgi:hypothetical protein